MSRSRRKHQNRVLGIPGAAWPFIIATLIAVLAVGGSVIGPTLATTGYEPEVVGSPSLRVENTHVDLGTFHWNELAEITYDLQNVGDEPLVITDTPTVQVVEGCCPPQAEVSKTTLRPGEKATITLRFSMHEGMDGPHDFRMQLQTNDPANPSTELAVVSNWVP